MKKSRRNGEEEKKVCPLSERKKEEGRRKKKEVKRKKQEERSKEKERRKELVQSPLSSIPSLFLFFLCLPVFHTEEFSCWDSLVLLFLVLFVDSCLFCFPPFVPVAFLCPCCSVGGSFSLILVFLCLVFFWRNFHYFLSLFKFFTQK